MLPIFEKVALLFKKHQRESIALFIIAIVALFSFGLGYGAAKDSTRTPIIIENRSGEQLSLITFRKISHMFCFFHLKRSGIESVCGDERGRVVRTQVVWHHYV